jgi:hypothetical protein
LYITNDVWYIFIVPQVLAMMVDLEEEEDWAVQDNLDEEDGDW